MKNICIVGGGLAGLSLGIALRKKGVPVSLHEAGSYPRHKVCGEFIAGVSNQTLEKLEIQDAFNQALTHQSLRWVLPMGRYLDYELPEPVKAVSRYCLDATLANTFAQLGGDLKTMNRISNMDANEGLVYTKGHHSQKSEWLGLKVHLVGKPAKKDLEMHLGDGGYLGVTAVEGGHTNLCGLFRKRSGLKGRKSAWLRAYLEACGMMEALSYMQTYEVVEESFCAVTHFKFGPCEPTQERLLLGDQWGMIPPFTGNGMSLAFESAAMAIDPLLEYAFEKRSWESVQHEIHDKMNHFFSRRMKTACVLHSFLLTQAGRQTIYALSRVGLFPFGLMYKLTH